MTSTHPLYERRRAGVLLHPTSLPGPLPHGQICHDAYRFIEFLADCGLSVWQMLPLGPTHSDFSPYQSLSAHACETSLISLDWLADRKLLDAGQTCPDFKAHFRQLQTAWSRFKKNKTSTLQKEFEQFIEEQSYWLHDYAVFMAIREQQSHSAWTAWPPALRDRRKPALAKIENTLADEIRFYCFTQFIFFQQWLDLKAYAQEHGVLLFGDLPIYVSLDSADVWCHRDLFLLDKQGQAKIVAGVPPDYFSETGQRWGNPQYNWKKLQAQDFIWWQQRLATQLELFDLVRIDHFRGFQAYWEIKAEQETAIEGRWVEAPGEALLVALKNRFSELPLVAEDLGVITDEVTALREQFELPGMKILQFAFDGNAANAYLPHNHAFKSVVYTGTHDNDTTLSWYQEQDSTQQDAIYTYLGMDKQITMPWALMQTALASVSCLSIVPMQDILSLGRGQRMNTPGTTEGNWQWRFSWQQLDTETKDRLKQLCQRYDR